MREFLQPKERVVGKSKIPKEILQKGEKTNPPIHNNNSDGKMTVMGVMGVLFFFFWWKAVMGVK